MSPRRILRWLLCLVAASGFAAGATEAEAATYTVTANRDSWIDESNTGTNNGAVTTLRATTNGSGAARTRTVIFFTLPAIPSNETITSVTLQLRVTTASTRVVNVHRMTAAWTEAGVTWANASTAFNGTVEASFTPSTVNAFVSPTVTSLVQGWYATPSTNHGMMLLGATSSTARFASKETGTATQRPQLIITTARIAPALTTVKSSMLVSDPYNGTVNPKAIPGAVVNYTVDVSNSSAGTADPDTTIVTDAVPAGMALFVGDYGGAGSGPVAFVNGSPSSGLTYTYTSLASTTDSLSFSNNGGASYAYTPVPDANGYDAAATHFRVSPTGSFAGTPTTTNPSFQLQLRMKIK